MPNGTVAIIGSPNVGKSTIFNRVLGKRHAIVNNESGITRDRLYARASWKGREFTLIDTGGIEIADRPFQEQIRLQAQIAIEQADVVVFMVDGQVGVTSDDTLVAKLLYKIKKPVLLAVNKIDDVSQIGNLADFYALGLGEPFPLSGAHGIGVGDLLDKIIGNLPPETSNSTENKAITFSVVGRPNVGKSSLVNALLSEERVIVSDISGTTRDAIDTAFQKDGKDYVVIDTAGLKKRGKIYEAIDKYAAIRALKAIERSEIVLLVIDGKQGIVEQDKHVIEYATELKKAIIIVVNKWDLVNKDTMTMSDYTRLIRGEYKFLDYAPICFVSALKKSRLNTLFECLNKVHEAYFTRVKTSLLNDILQEAQIMNPAPIFNKGRLKIFYASQVSVAPPTMAFFVNNAQFMHFSYLRYLENRLRESFNFDGTPIRILLKNKNEK